MKYSRLSPQKVRQIILAFCEDITATAAAKLLKANRNTINSYYNEIRRKISLHCLAEEKLTFGEFELDESYFGAHRVRGKRGRGAAGKTPVFGLLKRNGKIFVTIVPNCSREQLLPVIQGKILEGSTIHTDCWRAYDSLVLNGYDHYRVRHSHNEFARGGCHVNGVESFWSYAKRRLAKFNGCRGENFALHFKECEFRFNHRRENLVPLVRKIFKNP
jgi:transposase-like protein